MSTIDSIIEYLDSRVPSTSTFILRDKEGTVVADGAIFPDWATVTRSRPDIVSGACQTSVWNKLHHVMIQARRDNLVVVTLATGELLAALRSVLDAARYMDEEWQHTIVDAITDALIDELPGERERRDRTEAN